jgi:hypothetical protein
MKGRTMASMSSRRFHSTLDLGWTQSIGILHRLLQRVCSRAPLPRGPRVDAVSSRWAGEATERDPAGRL